MASTAYITTTEDSIEQTIAPNTRGACWGQSTTPDPCEAEVVNLQGHRNSAKSHISASDYLLDHPLGMNDIAQAGPGGSFATSKLTLKMVREMYYGSDIFPRMSLEKWQAQGKPTNDKYLREYTRHLLNSVQAPEDHDELVAKGEVFPGTL